jgi:predicted DNA binding CopG/RHH family protein
MKKRIVYTDEPSDVDLEHALRVKDFLPGPKDLVFRKERVVAVRLDDSTVSELKKVADEKGLGVSSLVRMWVRERLTKAHASL